MFSRASKYEAPFKYSSPPLGPTPTYVPTRVPNTAWSYVEVPMF